MAASPANDPAVPPKARKKKLMQSDVPAYSAVDARKVPEALRDQYAKQPATPLQVAKAMDVSPTSSAFKMITGSAVAYGLTDGAAQADRIGLTDLGRRVVAPLTEGDDVVAFREAVLKPRVTREFLEKYDGHKVPNRSIALNVLEEMGVPNEATERAFDGILDNARAAGYIETLKTGEYVSLEKPHEAVLTNPAADEYDDDVADADADADADAVQINGPAGRAGKPGDQADGTPEVPPAAERNSRVFISHGKNREIVDQLKEVLTFGGFEPIVSVENEALAKSIPDKVLDDMRSCSAGIVHVGSEKTLLDQDGSEQKILNSNVLIEIGAALALYGRRLILLVEEGTQLPSNLQGLYEARYSGGKLDYESTMKLLRTFNEFRKP